MTFDAKAAAEKRRQAILAEQQQQVQEAQLSDAQRQELLASVHDRAGELVVVLEDRVNQLENLDADNFSRESQQLKLDLEAALSSLGSGPSPSAKVHNEDKPKGGFLARALAKAKELDDRSQLGRKPEVK